MGRVAIAFGFEGDRNQLAEGARTGGFGLGPAIDGADGFVFDGGLVLDGSFGGRG